VGRFEDAVPLTDYQASLARLLSGNRTFDSYLAGGAAILIEPNTTRFSRDLDYFHDSEARVAEAFAADRRLLESRGYSIELDLNQPGFVRAIVSKDGHATKVEWVRDSAWRFMPTVRDDRVGFVLHPVDLAQPIDLPALKTAWLEALDSIEPFVASRPSEEVGCLYHSASKSAFVDPREATDAVPHFGRPGGVLPRVVDS